MSTERWRSLIDQLAALTPQQPATVAWRTVELDHLLRHDLPGGQGIDVGCGDGTIVAVLRRHGVRWRLVGVDPDEVETRLAEASGQYEAVHTAPGDRIPAPDGSFDFAFSNSVLEHVPNLPAVLREICRVLRPGAPLVATVPSAALNGCLAGPGLLAPILGRSRAEYLRGVDERLAHVNLWSPERWCRELRSAGLEVTHMCAYLSRRDVRRWERLSNWTGGLAYAASRRRASPLKISRRLDIGTGSGRSRHLRHLAAPLVRAAFRDFTPGSDEGSPDNPDFGCLLMMASRGAAPAPATSG